MKEYTLRLDKYGISTELYHELKWFCRQYHRKKAEIAALRGLSGRATDGLPRGSGVGSPTEQRALKAINLSRDVEMIEQAAIEADSTLYQQIMDNVTLGVRYADMPAPCGVNQFYAARRRFFWYLARQKEKNR